MLALPVGGTATVFVEWNDPFGASSNDYDAFLFDATSPGPISTSTNRQNGTQNPVEVVGVTNNTAQPQATSCSSRSSPAPRAPSTSPCSCSPFCLFFNNNADLNFNTISSSVPNNSDAGGNVLGLAAIDQADPGTDTAELYSSRGPTNDARNKPDVTTVDGVAITGNGGFPVPFFGTSAAAPHAGAIAALVLQCFPALKSGEVGDNPAADRATVRTKLDLGLTDLGTAGVDTTFGAGRMNAVTSTNWLRQRRRWRR